MRRFFSSYRGNAVSSGFNCSGEIPPFGGMTDKIFYFEQSQIYDKISVMWRVAMSGLRNLREASLFLWDDKEKSQPWVGVLRIY